MTERLALVLLAALAGGCAAGVSPGGDSFEGPKRVPDAPDAPSPDGPLRLVAVAPEPGSLIIPRTRFVLRFDRPIDPASLGAGALRAWYPDPRAEFLEDPFRLSALANGEDAQTLTLDPPRMLPGREVRIELLGIRGRDGRPLADDCRGGEHALSWHVRELPP